MVIKNKITSQIPITNSKIKLVKSKDAIIKPNKTKITAGLILNILIPGLGTLIAHRNNDELRCGIWQLVIAIVSVPLCFIAVGIVTGFATWIWALMTSIDMLTEE